MLIRLRPLAHAWRAPDSLQVGVSPGVATVIRGLDPRDRTWVSRLVEGIDVLDAASADPRLSALLDLLHEAGLLETVQPRPTRPARPALAPDPTVAPPSTLPLPGDRDTDASTWGLLGHTDGHELIRRRGAHRVRVTGRGRLPDAIRALLGAAGVPVAPASTSPPDLVVAVEAGVADAAAAAPLVASDVAHLSVVVRETDVVVGPLVVPGRTACLSCLELHRADDDPAWPRVARQIHERRPATVRTETSLVALAAGAAVGVALGHLDGLHVASGDGAAVTLDLAPARAQARSRRWLPHPACGCSWPPGGTESPAAAEEPAADGARIRAGAGRIGA